MKKLFTVLGLIFTVFITWQVQALSQSPVGSDFYYVGSNGEPQITYTCDIGWESFKDNSGYGCKKKVVTLPKPRDTKYYVWDTQQCQRIRYACKKWWEYFWDKIGCGCKKINKPEYREVQDYNFDLTIKKEWKKLILKWDKFSKNEKIKWFKFVYSQKNSQPVYPEDPALYLGSNPDLQSSVKYLKKGVYYVRLCAITEENARYCSKVQKITIEDNNESPIVCTREYEPVCGQPIVNCPQWAVCQRALPKTYSNKCVLKAEKAQYLYGGKCKNDEKKDYNISPNIKDKVDNLTGRFIKKLEIKKYSNDKIVSIIDQVIIKLQKLKTNPRYTAIVIYMVDVLNKYKDKYQDDFGIIEEIFSDY